MVDKKETKMDSMKSAKLTSESQFGAQEKMQVYRFVKRTMEKGVKGLKNEFLSMKRANNLTLMRKFVEMNPRGKNRYKDVGCLDATRVKLECCADDYIHANYVGTPNSSKRFICTQAPLEKTCKDFWMMCIQDRVEYIVMLCNIIEKGAKKCYQYFPANPGSLCFGDITIECIGSTMMRFTSATNAQVRISTLVVEQGGRKIRTRHIHWIDWPDRGVPPADTAIIQVLEVIKSTQSPIVVHCSAGVGRTGSMVLIQYILESICLSEPIEDCNKILLRIRSQRANTIQTDQQYLFVHQVLLNYFVENQLLDKRWKPFLNRFTAEYNKSVF